MTRGNAVAAAERNGAAPTTRQAVRLGTLVGLWVASTCLAAMWITFDVRAGQIGVDAHAYWLAGRSAHPYGPAAGEVDAFLYSPLFAQAMRPLSLLPWHVFLVVWMLAESAAFSWVVRPLPWVWRVPVGLLAVCELLMGNIYGFLAVAVVLGSRHSAAWVFPLLTKITVAVPGVVWFLLRGEWAQVARAAALTLTLVSVSAAADPQLWREWFGFLRAHGGQIGFSTWARLGACVAVAAWAARRDRPSALPLACLLAVPTWSGQSKDLALLLATPRLSRRGRVTKASSSGPDSLDQPVG